jgi:hypothetical protein
MNGDGLVADMISEEIDPADILHLVSEMGRRRDEGGEPNFFTQIAILSDRFPHGSLKPFVIIERMQALIPMMKDNRAKGWRFEGTEKGCTTTHKAMFRATALAPLHCPNGKKMKFDREEFFKIALAGTDTTGPVA